MKTVFSILKAVFVMLLLSRCSPSQNSITANIYHNTAAHYNGYFYAREKIREIEKIIWESIDENYHQIPKLYPEIDTALAASYKNTAEEAIKMAYISIKRHPHSRWLYPNYIIVGLARLYLHNFKNAIQTFKYVNTKSSQPAVQHTALLYLLRTLIANHEYKNAEEVIHYLEKKKLTKKNNQLFQLKKAYYYQVIKDYERMAQSLLSVTKWLSKKEDKGRISLITAQVCHKIGLYAEAHNYYKRCLTLNPEYSIDLHARLGLLQTTSIDGDKTAKKVNKYLEKLLADKKNVEFKSKIYYEMAEFKKHQGLLKEALAHYKSAVKAQGSQPVTADALLTLGQIHFDSLGAYAEAEDYYNRALSLLPNNIEPYKKIKKRQEALKELVKHLTIITWQDSLLNMATMDTAQLRTTLTLAMEAQLARKKAEEAKEAEEAENHVVSNTFLQASSGAAPGWYFENPTLVSLGIASFKRIWGNPPLEDNWRRSNKVATTPKAVPTEAVTERPVITATQITNKQMAEIEKVIRQLPKTPSAKKEALRKIEDAYFMTGSIFQYKLLKKKEAIASYTTILNRFPTSQQVPKALYQLYLISASKTHPKENIYYQKLVADYPHSGFTKRLLDPTYLTKQKIIIKTQKEMYQAAYNEFKKGDIRAAQEKANSAIGLGTTHFTPQLELLNVLIVGKTEPIDVYKHKIEMFLKKYPENTLNDYAKKLLITADELKKTVGSNKIRYIPSTNAPHCFAFTYLDTDTIPHTLSIAIKKIIELFPKTGRPEVSRVVLSKDYMISFVCEFTNGDAASAFFDRLNKEVDVYKICPQDSFHIFIITKDNLTTLRRTQALEEYMAFFDRNYNTMISTMEK